MIELNNRSEIVFHLENDEGEKVRYPISLAIVQELCEDSVYEGIESPCMESSCNNESQNFCSCGGELQDYEIKSMSVKIN